MSWSPILNLLRCTEFRACIFFMDMGDFVAGIPFCGQMAKSSSHIAIKQLIVQFEAFARIVPSYGLITGNGNFDQWSSSGLVCDLCLK